MTFALNGTTITQSDTDTDLSGLAGIAGVTVETNGDHKRYTLDGVNLSVRGVLSIDPETEQLYFTETQPQAFAVEVYWNGTLHVGTESLVNGDKIYSTGCWLKTTRRSSAAYIQGQASLMVQNTATMTWNGGDIDVSASAVFRAAPSVGQAHAYLRDTDNQPARLFGVANGAFENFTCYGNGFTTDEFTTPSFANIELVNGFTGFAGRTEQLEIQDLKFVAQGTISVYGNDKSWFLRNADRGTETPVQSSLAGATGFYTLCTKSLAFTFVDGNGQGIENVKVYSAEHDHGTRRDVGDGQFASPETVTALSSSNGVANVDHFRLGAYFRDGAGSENEGWQRFTKSGDTSDVQDFYFVTYGHKLAFEDIALKGTGVLALTKPLVEDTAVTQADMAIVAAYASIDTAQQFYDAAKLYLFNNFSGETALLATRFDNALDVGNYDVVIDATAAQAFAFDGQTITIKSALFSGDITTTANVSLLNGAKSTGSIKSATFDSFLKFDEIESWSIFSSDADREAKINSLGEGATSDLFQFVYAAGTVYYLRVISGGVELFMTLTPQTAGETEVTLGIQAQLLTLTNKINTLPTAVWDVGMPDLASPQTAKQTLIKAQKSAQEAAELSA